MNIRLVACTLIIATLLTGCKKYELEKEVDQTFSTSYNEPLTVDIYQSRDDYANNRNVWKQMTVQAGKSQTLSMEIGRQYWIDWYNADYTLTNWLSRSGDIPSEAVFSPGENNKPYDLKSNYEYGAHDARRCLLPGNATSSTWRGVSKNNGPGNPQTAAPFLRVVFHKDFRTELEYDKPGSGREQVNGSFKVSVETPYASPYVNAGIYTADEDFVANCRYSEFSDFPTSEDTFSCDFYNYSGSLLYSYVIVRQ